MNKLEIDNVAATKIAKQEQKLQKEIIKEEARAERERDKKMSTKVTVKRSDRAKKKTMTVVIGLDVFGVDLKKTSKMFSSHFACGCSVVKNILGAEEVTIQGDFVDEVCNLLYTKYPQIPRENIVQVEEKKSKKKI
ncbi:hypothetical protein BB561_004849 [Smittium simulii]|uniref:Translation machinery-associated protein 22 n=1 Tax=Smittium simulii TaxID=133385 RepID=A0A2T9YDY4_9FUNG|nr:hypothetical protein BB561_004849 [Smittium simulii]